MKVPPFDMPLEEIRASLEKLRRPLSVAILRARNPFNVGAIIRVAHSFLVREILLVGDERFYERFYALIDRFLVPGAVDEKVEEPAPPAPGPAVTSPVVPQRAPVSAPLATPPEPAATPVEPAPNRG